MNFRSQASPLDQVASDLVLLRREINGGKKFRAVIQGSKYLGKTIGLVRQLWLAIGSARSFTLADAH